LNLVETQIPTTKLTVRSADHSKTSFHCNPLSEAGNSGEGPGAEVGWEEGPAPLGEPPDLQGVQAWSTPPIPPQRSECPNQVGQ